MFKIYNQDMGGTYLVPIRNYCVHGYGLKTLPGRDSPASVSLKEVIRIVKLGLPCQIVSANLGLLHDL